MLKIKGPSGWKFDGSSSFGVGIGPVGGGSGSFVLTHPEEGTYTFKYKHAGGGYSVGPKLQKGLNVSAGFDTNVSAGKLYILDTFPGKELRSSDIEGFCIIVEAAISAGKGVSGACMLLGVPMKHVEQEVAADITQFAMVAGYGYTGQMALDILDANLPGLFQTYSKACLLMGGFNQSGLSAGILGSVGYVSRADLKQNDGVKHQIRITPEKVELRSRNTAKEETAMLIPGDALFDFDKFEINPAADVVLEKAGKFLLAHPGRRIQITGHTDGIGTKKYNKKLSEKRAEAVKRWLVARHYRKDSEVSVYGDGEEKPVADNKSAAGRARNRRVEIVLIPK